MADEISAPAPPTDLLGDPYKPLPERRGRRKLRFSPEVYEKVERFSAAGMTQEQIAAALKVDPKTLRKYFSPELLEGPARQRAELLSALMDKATKGAGNVAAIRAALAEIEKAERRTARAYGGHAPAPRSTAKEPVEPRAPQLGKKEQLAKRAGEPPKDWAELVH